MWKSIIASATAIGLLASAAWAAPPTAAQKCEAAKLKAAGKYHFCRIKADRKVVLQGGSPNYSACNTTLTNKWTAAEISFGGSCPTTGDQATIQGVAAGDAAGVASRLSPLPAPGFYHTFPASGQTTAYTANRNGAPGSAVPDDGTLEEGAALEYVDNGDGTITDMNPGLMWEKKSDDGGLHDQDNSYPWSDVSTDTIWDWLDDVNAEGGTGFAGYNDWRIPSIKELHSILNYEIPYPAPTVATAFNNGCGAACTVTSCSCTAPYTYWSSSTIAGSPASAWGATFYSGFVDGLNKTSDLRVRAVRGGS